MSGYIGLGQAIGSMVTLTRDVTVQQAYKVGSAPRLEIERQIKAHQIPVTVPTPSTRILKAGQSFPLMRIDNIASRYTAASFYVIDLGGDLEASVSATEFIGGPSYTVLPGDTALPGDITPYGVAKPFSVPRWITPVVVVAGAVVILGIGMTLIRRKRR